MEGDANKFSAEQILKLIRTKKERFWLRERERRPLSLFHEAARRVPAYRDFLIKNKIDPDRIKSFSDFQAVPPVNKKNYLRQYPLEKLCWDGSLKRPLVWTSTSGSTGEPFYFPRGERLDWESSVFSEMFLSQSSFGDRGPILVIVGFGMGVWIGGLINYQGFHLAAERGWDISIITPGINKAEVLNALKKLAPRFAQTILIGYPPFVKDILDEAPHRGINIKKLNLRLLFAAEMFTEKFRDYVAEKAGVRNSYLDTLNIYGTADIGTMAWETPTAILIRRLAVRHPKLFQDLFSKIYKTPTLAQYNPLFITFEASEGNILLTGSSAIPLVRYAVGDHGGVFGYREAVKTMKLHRIDLAREAASAGLPYLYQFPFVYVYERDDLSTTLYGLQIYPETIREVLWENPLHRYLTGKFTMITRYDTHQNQYLEINVELKRGKNATTHLRQATRILIMKNLLDKNSEYRHLAQMLPARVEPKIVFWDYEHALHFKPGIKQKWVKK